MYFYVTWSNLGISLFFVTWMALISGIMNEYVFKIRKECCYVGRVRGNRCENTKRKKYLNEIFYILKRICLNLERKNIICFVINHWVIILIDKIWQYCFKNTSLVWLQFFTYTLSSWYQLHGPLQQTSNCS